MLNWMSKAWRRFHPPSTPNDFGLPTQRVPFRLRKLNDWCHKRGDRPHFGLALLYSLLLSVNLWLLLVFLFKFAILLGYWLEPIFGYVIGDFIASLSLTGYSYPSFLCLPDCSQGNIKIFESWQVWFSLGWVILMPWLVTFVTFINVPTLAPNCPFDQNFFRQHGFTWYFPLYYSITFVLPGMILLYELAQGQSWGAGLGAAAILLAPAATMMAAGRSNLTRLKNNLETFGGGAELLRSQDSAIAGLVILKNLVEYDEGFRMSAIDTVVGYVRTNYAWSNQRDAQEDNHNGEVLQVALDLIGEMKKDLPADSGRQIRLHGLDLRGRRLEGNWRNVNLEGTHLGGANLLGADLSNAELEGANLDNATLQDDPDRIYGDRHDDQAVLREAHMFGTRLRGVDLSNFDLEYARLEYADLREAKLYGVHLESAYLDHTHFKNAIMREAHLENARLTEAHFEGADMQWTHLGNAYFWRAHLEGADLREGHLEGVKLGGSYLQDAKLQKAHLEGADLENVHLEGADLQEAHLEGSNMSGVYLDNANLADAFLSCQKEDAKRINALLANPKTARSEAAPLFGEGEYGYMGFEDPQSEILWPKGVPSSIKGIRGISVEELPPHWRDLER